METAPLRLERGGPDGRVEVMIQPAVAEGGPSVIDIAAEERAGIFLGSGPVARLLSTASRLWSVPRLRTIATAALVGAAYFLAATVSLRVALVGGQVTPIWPSTGIALVGILLFGRKVWPGIAIAAFLVNAPIGPTIFSAVGIACGNTLAPLIAAMLFERVGFRLELDRLRDAVAMVLVGGLCMTISATGGALILLLSRTIAPGEFWSTWSVWWAGDAMGVIIVAPFLLSRRSPPRLDPSWRPRVEAVVLFVGLVVTARVVFTSPLQIEYLVFPFLAWAAWRFGQRGAAPAALIASGIAIAAAVTGTGPFASGTLIQHMVTLQVFNATVAFTSIVLGSVVAERAQHIAQQHRAEEELARQALHDPLTGLANRVLLLENLGHALARAERRGSWVSVLFLDLDRFKVINDSLGHDVGDRVLVCMADRLRSVSRPGDTASRFGGDEFVILCEDVESEEHAAGIAERISRAVAEPIPLDAGQIVVTTSVGISLAKGSTANPEHLLRDADAAVYRAKERGRARAEVFDHGMRAHALERLQIESELRRAIETGALRLHYQPIVSLQDGRVEFVEALVRWEHPTRGLVAPDEFIHIAEETGLIVPLGTWVLEEACSQAAAWRRMHRPSTVRVAVNLSARQLARPDFEDTLRRTLVESDAEPTSLCLEITETALMEATPTTLDILLRLREMGVYLVIDDFGTGYSSLGYLKRFQVDALKVDRSFVGGLGREGEDSAIVAAVISLAHALGLVAVAEGVETEAQLEHLLLLGCDLAQGYHFGRPQAAGALEELLAERVPSFG